MQTTITIDSDGVLTFPDEIIQATGWKEGDMLEWNENPDGSWSLTKAENDFDDEGI
tara:strand:- start:73 stop:240 length:168 start_codon:yes stop_codon:yes gene_type:complete